MECGRLTVDALPHGRADEGLSPARDSELGSVSLKERPYSVVITESELDLKRSGLISGGHL